ncbi:MAG TPA: hypothetical protein VFM70_01445 [Salinimicrobium sp.]|nr:hypothetical protein [Salinimicrobium sp.]
MKIGNLSINQKRILKIILMIVVILIVDNIVARMIETNMLAMILIGLNLAIYFLFLPYIKKEVKDEGSKLEE